MGIWQKRCDIIDNVAHFIRYIITDINSSMYWFYRNANSKFFRIMVLIYQFSGNTDNELYLYR